MVAKSKKGTLTKQNIINAAKQLFYENGYNKTGIQDIADYANVKLGTITYYFKKKDDMTVSYTHLDVYKRQRLMVSI